MCGIFGLISDQINDDHLQNFIKIGILSERRGKDSSGLLYFGDEGYKCSRADMRFSQLIKKERLITPRSIVIGHSRLITNGQLDNQPVVRDNIAVIHNGIITNDDEYWVKSNQERLFSIDTEAILGVAKKLLSDAESLSVLFDRVLEACKGAFSCALVFPGLGKIVLMSNTGSLYISENKGTTFFASEKIFLEKSKCENIRKIKGQEVIDIPISHKEIKIFDYNVTRTDLIPKVSIQSDGANKLVYPQPNLRRCTCCILPETMPYIKYNELGICNYCTNYRPKNTPKRREILTELLEKYKFGKDIQCIMPFSGGRDSSYALHLLVREFGVRPVTMTYDWGMVTDLARRNISRMCAELGVENILIADDISKKRNNIKLNLQAWLRKPDLGMINILMAGDKHFFRHIETVRRETGISLNIWGMNPLEVTHFKAGFLGFPPDFETKQVFYTGLLGQLKYQALRAKAMIDNPNYINRSLWDTLTGEYYRSVKKKTDFYNLFDYWLWDESAIDTAIQSYGWEKAVDTNSTWRIGDGTAAFYNYVYYTMAGFTEYDTFRSNQIREGQISREQALTLVAEENQPRFNNIKWYLDAVDMDFDMVVGIINKAPRKY